MKRSAMATVLAAALYPVLSVQGQPVHVRHLSGQTVVSDTLFAEGVAIPVDVSGWSSGDLLHIFHDGDPADATNNIGAVTVTGDPGSILVLIGDPGSEAGVFSGTGGNIWALAAAVAAREAASVTSTTGRVARMEWSPVVSATGCVAGADGAPRRAEGWRRGRWRADRGCGTLAHHGGLG